MQAASVQKPSASSLQLLPSADVWLTRHWSDFLLLTCRDTSIHAKCEKNLQCWRVADTSNNEISFFGRKLFIFRYNWRVHYTSAIKSSGQALRFFLSFDVWLTRQWPTFYVFLCCLTCAWHVNDTFSLSLTCGPHVTEANFFYWRVNHTSVHAKCEKNGAWRVTHTSVLHFLCPWRVVHTSLKRICQKSCFFVPLTCGWHVSEIIG